MSHSVLRKAIKGIEFYIIRDGNGGYVINDNTFLDESVTNYTYNSVGRAYQAAYDWIIKGVPHNTND